MRIWKIVSAKKSKPSYLYRLIFNPTPNYSEL